MTYNDVFKYHAKMSSLSVFSVLKSFWDDYRAKTPQKLKIVDAYLAYIMLTGIVQFAYCALVGTFPFNSFLSGFISCVASFVLGGKKETLGRLSSVNEQWSTCSISGRLFKRV